MSIIGVGIDIIEITRIQRILFRFGYKFIKKILSKNEIKKYVITKHCIQFIAKKFVAKEAALKALGTGIQFGISFNQIETYHNHLGKPKLRFLKNALKQLEEIQCKSIHISISDQNKYACAIVILEN
ncbi:MAG: holo-ACP synthase [Buchnera aphidicola (Pentalonia nigronervosa)]|jgi:holo-[acyl-carrier protein] synthase|uniref:Holo-[acyl-carrier-protein] synthase n=1 Tax=Buchnera aphidicola (Pentalonia nigronervosa) TaxID=1309793 RepID=A0A7H1AZQ1_9GAMM|nr:MAG: holo-ACP synthase [Buchnera aphidicola (Pentalonia nigronervosa)]